MAIRSFNDLLPRLAPGAWVDPTAVVIGDVDLGRDVSIWPGTIVRGDVNYITIGDETNVQDGSVLHVTHRSDANPQGFPLRIRRHRGPQGRSSWLPDR